GISISTPEGKFIECNSEAYKLSDCASKEEFLNTPALEHYHDPKDRARFVELHKKGLVKDFEVRLKRKDGTTYWSSITSTEQKIGNQISYINTFQDITDRKKAEKALKKSEHKYRSLFDNMVEGFAFCKIITDENNIPVDFLYLEINDAFERLTGLEKEETVGKRVTEVIPGIEDSEPNLFEIYGKVALTGVSTKFELFFEPLKIWLSIMVYSPKKNYFVAVFDNITERKKKEDELRLHSEIMTNMSEGVNLVRLDDGIIVYTNPVFEAMFGYNPGEMIGKDIVTANAPADKTPEETKDEIMGILKETGEWHGEVNNIRKDGTPFWCYANVSVFDHPEYGKVLVSIHTDITERKKTDQKLKESEEKFRMLFESSTDGIVSVDMEGRIIDVNNAYLKMLGFSKEELLRLNFRDITPQKWHEMEDNLIASQLSGASDSVIYEKEYIKKNGTILPINARIWIIKDALGDPVMTWGIVRDITDRKKKEKEIFDLAQFPSEDPYPILRVNRNGIIYINEAGQKLLHIVDFKQIPEIFQESMKMAFEKNQITEVEVEFDSRIYSFTITPVKDANYVNIYGMDITERKRVEEKLKEVNKLKSEFLRRASHELKTPLISIKG
ncbi:hypothetical protein LCGC14_2224800, partial [marine sediment metagenome]